MRGAGSSSTLEQPHPSQSSSLIELENETAAFQAHCLVQHITMKKKQVSDVVRPIVGLRPAMVDVLLRIASQHCSSRWRSLPGIRSVFRNCIYPCILRKELGGSQLYAAIQRYRRKKLNSAFSLTQDLLENISSNDAIRRSAILLQIAIKAELGQSDGDIWHKLKGKISIEKHPQDSLAIRFLEHLMEILAAQSNYTAAAHIYALGGVPPFKSAAQNLRLSIALFELNELALSLKVADLCLTKLSELTTKTAQRLLEHLDLLDHYDGAVKVLGYLLNQRKCSRKTFLLGVNIAEKGKLYSDIAKLLVYSLKKRPGRYERFFFLTLKKRGLEAYVEQAIQERIKDARVRWREKQWTYKKQIDVEARIYIRAGLLHQARDVLSRLDLEHHLSGFDLLKCGPANVDQLAKSYKEIDLLLEPGANLDALRDDLQGFEKVRVWCPSQVSCEEFKTRHEISRNWDLLAVSDVFVRKGEKQESLLHEEIEAFSASIIDRMMPELGDAVGASAKEIAPHLSLYFTDRIFNRMRQERGIRLLFNSLEVKPLIIVLSSGGRARIWQRAIIRRVHGQVPTIAVVGATGLSRFNSARRALVHFSQLSQTSIEDVFEKEALKKVTKAPLYTLDERTKSDIQNIFEGRSVDRVGVIIGHFSRFDTNTSYKPYAEALVRTALNKDRVLLFVPSWVSRDDDLKIRALFRNEIDEGQLSLISPRRIPRVEHRQRWQRRGADILRSVVNSNAASQFSGDELFALGDLFARVFMGEFPAYFELLSLLSRLIDSAINIQYAVTSLERGPLSRCFISLCTNRGIPTIGAQIVFVSNYIRYKAPKTEYYAVIDTSSAEFHCSYFGVAPERILLAGTANINPQKLQLLGNLYSRSDIRRAFGWADHHFCLLYASQHNSGGESLEIVKMLCDACMDINDLRVAVCPHPHESATEIANYDKICETMGAGRAVVIRDRSTYDILPACDVLITRFSNIGLEAAVMGKDVIAINLTSKPHPVRLEKLGVAELATEKSELYNLLNDFKHEGRRLKRLRSSREEYFRSNPQLMVGDPAGRIIDFIRSKAKNAKDKDIIALFLGNRC
jgi:hypothetical protein